MKIRSLDIERFGKFSNKKITLPDAPFVIISGPNEAGKSTLMAFITTMLFGFPTRQKRLPWSKSNHQAHLGGKLIAEMENQDVVTIERYEVDKEPLVYSRQSAVKNQELMQSIIKGLDRALFEAIFCFDLSGLNGLENIKDDELNHYLFSTGMMGSARIQRLEKALDKYQNDLFKPSGKKPVLNKILTKLESDTSQSVNWVKQNDAYIRLKEKKRQAEASLVDIQRQKEALQNKADKIEKYLTLKPLILDYIINQKKADACIDARQFPEDGIVRLENWQQQFIGYHGDLEEVQEAMNRLKYERDRLDIDDHLLEKAVEIESLLNTTSYIERLQKEHLSQKDAVDHINEQLTNYLAELGEGWSERHIESMDTGLSAKETLKDVLTSFSQVKQDKRTFELSLSGSNEKLLAYRDKLNNEKNKQLTEDERQSLQTQILADEEQQELRSKAESLKEIKKQKDNQTKSIRQIGNKIIMGGSIFGILLMIGLLFLNEVMFGITIGIVLTLSSVFIRQFLLRMVMKEVDQLTKDLSLINNKLINLTNYNIKDIEERLRQDEMTTMVVDVIGKQIQEEELNYQDLSKKLNHFETQELILEKQYEEWCQNFGFPQNMSKHIILDLFDLIDQSKRKLREKQRVLVKLNTIEKELTDYHQRFSSVLKDLSIEPTMTNEELKHRLTLEKQKLDQKHQLQQQLAEKQEQMKSLQRKMAHVTKEIDALYHQASVNHEDQFREKAKMNEELTSLQATLEGLSNQIDLLTRSKEERQFYWELVTNGKWDSIRSDEYENKINAMIDEEKNLRQLLSDTKSEMKYLEESHNHSNLIHAMENDRSLFHHYAKKWAVYRTAAEILRLTKEQYRKDRLPRLLKTASGYFNKITNGKYIDIIITENDGFSVATPDGDIFSVIELSRGTKEQLYLSIRLALATLFDSVTSYPLIIDDSFVNFDYGRLSSVVDLLIEISNQRQIILFTCHNKSYNQYSNIPVVSLTHDVEEALYD